MSVRIAVEGKTDKKFLEDYLIRCLKLNLKNEHILNIEGKDNRKKAKPELQPNFDNGGINILVFDADDDFSARMQYIQSIKNEYFAHHVFLFPDNNRNGEIETLLEEIINPEHKKIFECFEHYQSCLDKHGRYKVPALKTKIFAYCDSLDLENESLAKEENRDYCDISKWNLNHPSLTPLKDFLMKYI